MKENYLEKVTRNSLAKDFEKYQSLMEKMEEDIVSFLKVRDIRGLLTENKDDISKDSIYGYMYSDGGELEELQVKAVMLDETEKHITFIMDSKEIVYDTESVLSEFATKSDYFDHWFSIRDGVCLGWFTLLNIVECITEYAEEERYIK